MGYIIDSSIFKKQSFVIPEADVQIMDSNQVPYSLLIGNAINFNIPVACTIRIANNQTIPYTGATHIHLTSTNNYAVGDISATYALNASINNNLTAGETYSMLCNFQASPNRFGGIHQTKNLEIFFDNPITGNGDMIVDLIYFTL